MWYLIVSIPDICTLTYPENKESPIIRYDLLNISFVNKESPVNNPVCSSVLNHMTFCINRGSYMSVHVLLNLLNSLRKRNKMLGKPRILSLFRNELNIFNQEHEC